jgi:hypothetical protein
MWLGADSSLLLNILGAVSLVPLEYKSYDVILKLGLFETIGVCDEGSHVELFAIRGYW